MGITVLDPIKNAKTKVKPNPDCAHMVDKHFALITLKEYSRAASSFPIVLIKNKETDRYSSVVMLGLEQSENLFYGKEQWHCSYAPMSILRHPFVLSRDENDSEPNRLTTFYIDDDGYVSEEEGQPLFAEDGKPTEVMTHYYKLLRDLFENEKETFAFIQKMTELDLIVPFTLETFLASGGKRQLTGLNMIDNRRLAALPDETILELHKLDFLRAIHAMDISLGTFVNMIKLKNANSTDQIVNFQLA